MDILVVSACSGDKIYDESPIGCDEIDSIERIELVRKYPDYVARAAEMYVGDEHQIVRKAVDNLREHGDVSWRILSAGYGLISENEEIVAYDCSLSDIEPVRERVGRLGYNPDSLTIDETRQVIGKETGACSDFKKALGDGFDLVFLTLSEPYLVAIAEALSEIPEDVMALCFASKGSRSYTGDAYWVPTTESVRSELGSSWFTVRGELLQNLSEVADTSALEWIVSNPVSLDDYLDVPLER